MKEKTKIYSIAVSWEMYGKLKIEASSFEEAIRLAYEEDTELPHGEYVEASFTVDEEISRILNNEEKKYKQS